MVYVSNEALGRDTGGSKRKCQGCTTRPSSELSSSPRFDPEDTGKKVAKLIPSELITAYTGLVSFTGAVKFQWLHNCLFVASFLLCLALTPIYLDRMADKGKPKRNHLIVSTAAFVVWAYFVSGQQVMPQWYDAGLASMATIVFSVVSALVPLDR